MPAQAGILGAVYTLVGDGPGRGGPVSPSVKVRDEIQRSVAHKFHSPSLVARPSSLVAGGKMGKILLPVVRLSGIINLPHGGGRIFAGVAPTTRIVPTGREAHRVPEVAASTARPSHSFASVLVHFSNLPIPVYPDRRNPSLILPKIYRVYRMKSRTKLRKTSSFVEEF